LSSFFPDFFAAPERRESLTQLVSPMDFPACINSVRRRCPGRLAGCLFIRVQRFGLNFAGDFVSMIVTGKKEKGRMEKKQQDRDPLFESG